MGWYIDSFGNPSAGNSNILLLEGECEKPPMKAWVSETVIARTRSNLQPHRFRKDYSLSLWIQSAEMLSLLVWVSSRAGAPSVMIPSTRFRPCDDPHMRRPS